MSGDAAGDGFDAGQFARAFQGFMHDMHTLARQGVSPVRDLMDAHFDGPSGELPVLADRLEAPEHPNVQRCVDEPRAAHLAAALRRLQESSAPVLRALLGAGGAAESTVIRG